MSDAVGGSGAAGGEPRGRRGTRDGARGGTRDGDRGGIRNGARDGTRNGARGAGRAAVRPDDDDGTASELVVRDDFVSWLEAEYQRAREEAQRPAD